MANSGGEIRRSTAVNTSGPGAVVDLRGDGGAPISTVMAGLDAWQERLGDRVTKGALVIHEPRLERRLGLKRFVLPPVAEEYGEGGAALPAVRFPVWLQCPNCHELKRASQWGKSTGKAGRHCPKCSGGAESKNKIFAVPVRFVTACSKGHLDEFPWDLWVQHTTSCPGKGDLKLDSVGAGLAGLKLTCNKCQSSRSMDGIFSQKGLSGLSCLGQRPWLSVGEADCDQPLMTVQRGASNLYFPITESALTIPPYADHMADLFGDQWETLRNIPSEQRGPTATAMAGLYPSYGYTPEALLEFAARLDRIDVTDDSALRNDEFDALNAGVKYDQPGAEFSLRPGSPGKAAAPFLGRVSRVPRLREVRAIRGFTRLAPPSGDFKLDTGKSAALSTKPHLDWLPAIEVRGEGIFVSLAAEPLYSWEALPRVVARAAELDKRHLEEHRARYGDEAAASRVPLSPRYLLVHSLAHALIRYLSLDCGYSSASLRERIFCSPRERRDHAGVLIYTSTTDADGTLGGLARQGLPRRFDEVLTGAIRDLHWCASDPLCIEGMAALSDGLNGAACHGCLLAAETSCESFNRGLDRAFLVGLVAQPELGFFRSLLE